MNLKRLGQLHKELAELREKARIIRARNEVEIFSDPMTNIDYNSRSRLRDAKVTLLLANDAEYQAILNRIFQVDAERVDSEFEAEMTELNREVK